MREMNNRHFGIMPDPYILVWDLLLSKSFSFRSSAAISAVMSETRRRMDMFRLLVDAPVCACTASLLHHAMVNQRLNTTNHHKASPGCVALRSKHNTPHQLGRNVPHGPSRPSPSQHRRPSAPGAGTTLSIPWRRCSCLVCARQ